MELPSQMLEFINKNEDMFRLNNQIIVRFLTLIIQKVKLFSAYFNID